MDMARIHDYIQQDNPNGQTDQGILPLSKTLQEPHLSFSFIQTERGRGKERDEPDDPDDDTDEGEE